MPTLSSDSDLGPTLGQSSLSGSSPLLTVNELCVDVRSASGSVRLVDGFGLTIDAGERIALVGESGSGKSVTARALMRLDANVHLSGSVRLGESDVLNASEREMTQLRGSRIGMVFQDPMGALNPLRTIGDQIAEPLRLRGISRKDAARRVREVLDELGVASASARMKAYPHEFSGGMRQRVVLAMALIGDPELLIADEPTTALDVRVQEQILNLLDDVSRRRNLSVLLITHDLGVVAGFANRVVVMYAGRKIEERATFDLYENPAHPYTAALLRAVPRIDQPSSDLQSISGVPPSPTMRPSGCAYHPRCPFRMEICSEDIPEPRRLPQGGTAACYLITDEEEESSS